MATDPFWPGKAPGVISIPTAQISCAHRHCRFWCRGRDPAWALRLFRLARLGLEWGDFLPHELGNLLAREIHHEGRGHRTWTRGSALMEVAACPATITTLVARSKL